MIDAHLNLLAQGPSAAQPSRYVLFGHLVPVDDPSSAQRVEALISAVTSRSAKQAGFAGNAAIFLHRDEFVLYAVPKETDERGRLAPVACHGQVPHKDDDGDAWASTVLASVEEFATIIGRSLDDEARRGARDALLWAKKKRTAQRFVRAFLLFSTGALLLTALGILVYFLEA